MLSSSGNVDFFISRRGSAAAYAQEVAQVLIDAGYAVLVQDFDFKYGTSIPGAMHDALKRTKHLIVLLTKDYESSYYTLAELFNFIAAAARSAGEQRLIVLRVEECEPQGLLAGVLYGDLCGVTDPNHRREIILATAEGRSVVQRHGPKVFNGVPQRNPDFTGRDNVLLSLHHAFVADGQNSTLPVAIHGLGGLGKSSLAVHYAHRYSNDYAGVWWTSAESRDVLINNLADLARLLDPGIASNIDSEKAAKLAVAKLTNTSKPWLLIFDNVTHPNDVSDCFPPRGARVIITSRWTSWLGRAIEFELGVLEPAEAVEFLLKITDGSDRSGAEKLTGLLGYLPLAIEHAGAFIKLSGVSFEDYAREVDKLIAMNLTQGIGRYSVAATFAIATRKATDLCPEAVLLLAVLSVFSPERIPLTLIDNAHALWTSEKRAEALAALSAVSLIKHDPFPDGTAAVSVHRLVQSTMRSQLAAMNALDNYIMIGIGAIALVFPDYGDKIPKDWRSSAQLLPHALFLRNEVLRVGEHIAALYLNKVTSYLYLRGAYAPAAALLLQLVELQIEALGVDHPKVASSASYLARLLQTTGDLAEAERLLRDALRILEANYGAEDHRVALALNNLALVLRDRGDFCEAEALLRRAVKIGEQDVAQDDIILAFWRDNLAGILHHTGRHEEAEPIIRESIEAIERRHGAHHPDVATALVNLADLLRATNRHVEAEAVVRRSIAIKEQVFGSDHPELVSSLNALGHILRQTKRSAEAEHEYRRAIAVFEKAHAADHPLLSTLLNNLAAALGDSKRFLEAEPLLRRAMAISMEDIQGRGAQLPQILLNLVLNLQSAGANDKAAEVANSALVTFDKALGSKHRLTLLAASLLAGMAHGSGRIAEAADIATRYGLELTATENGCTITVQGLQQDRIQIDSRGAIINYVKQQQYLAWIDAFETETKAGRAEPGLQELAYVALLNQGIELAALARDEPDSIKATLHWTSAEAKYRKALNVDPSGHEAMHNWGNALVSRAKRSNDPAEAHKLFLQAEKQYRAALRIKPGLEAALTNYGNTLIKLATSTRDQEQAKLLFERAIAARKSVVDLNPQLCSSLRKWANALIDYADHLTDIDKSTELSRQGEQILCRLIEIEPDNYEVHMALGSTLFRRAQRFTDSAIASALMQEAEQAYRNALELRPDYPIALYHLALSLDTRARVIAGPASALFDEAEAKYRDTVRVEPNNHRALTNLGVLLLERAQAAEEKEQAERFLTEAHDKFIAALKYQPDDFEAFLNIGNVFLLRVNLASDPAEADSLLEIAATTFAEGINKKPGHSAAISSLAMALAERALRISDSTMANFLFEQAELKFEEAVGLNGTSSEIFEIWGSFLLRRAKQLNEHENGKQLLRKAKDKFVKAENSSLRASRNLACVSALLGLFDDCQLYLEAAGMAGDLASVDLDDEDFDSVRSLPWFIELRKRTPSGQPPFVR
jgi:tetratricopeptide (TPR) repeat protein